MTTIAKVNVSMDRRCAECRKPGATESGICLRCIGRAMGREPLRSAIGRAVQARIKAAVDGSKGQGPFRRIGAAFDAAAGKP